MFYSCRLGSYFSVVGIEVKAGPAKRRPRMARLPDATMNSAEPRLPSMAAKPGRLLRKTAILFLAGRKTLDVPMTSPFALRTVITIVVATELGLTIATAV